MESKGQFLILLLVCSHGSSVSMRTAELSNFANASSTDKTRTAQCFFKLGLSAINCSKCHGLNGIEHSGMK